MQFTFKSLLENYSIVIPQIQRDYAQGRKSETDLRKDFIGKIKGAIYDEVLPLNLDFIYGYTEKSSNENWFIPLDGQQRLTTLWLLHWILAPRENGTMTDDMSELLTRFTYETRISSKRFCKNLVNQPFYLIGNSSISSRIIDSAWFMASWINDPTVISMLNMLDTLHEEFVDKDLAWNNLIANSRVTFDFIDIKSEEFKLTDELYIKMNSRGKPLTKFENFKAQFAGLLASPDTEYFGETREYEKSLISYQQYFAFKIDSTWIDLFWNYRQSNNGKIDDYVYNFINYAAEILYYKSRTSVYTSDLKFDFEFLNGVFSTSENVNFLFNSLDFLSSLNDVKGFFQEIFKEVSTFDVHSEDYFFRAMSNLGFDVKDKAILYAILCFCTISPKREKSELFDFVRIVRNLLLTVRQPNQTKRIEFASNLRMPNMSDYCKFIDDLLAQIKIEPTKKVYEIFSENDFSGFTRENIANEKAKAGLLTQIPTLRRSVHALEEHPQIQGNTSNFRLDSPDIERKITAFLNIWDSTIEDSLIIRALLTIGNYSVITHPYSSLGKIRYFGCKNNWNRILTAYERQEREKVQKCLDEFLAAYDEVVGTDQSEKLQFLIDNFDPEEKSWRYYFVKYEPITDASYYSKLSDNPKLNLFTWNDAEGFNINNLGNSGNLPLHSYHLNPYLICLRKIFADRKDLTLYFGRFTDLSWIRIKGKIDITCKSDGWQVVPLRNYTIPKSIATKFNLVANNDNTLILPDGGDNRMKIIEQFIEELSLAVTVNEV